MLRTRIIPCLLLKGRGLVKTVRFDNPKYVGDPINAVKIFNDKAVDELMLLDITATEENRGPNYELIAEIAEECFMPMAYGGGISSMADIGRILKLGVEKVVLNTSALQHPDLVAEAAREFGAQAIVVSIDVKRKLLGGYQVASRRARQGTGRDPLEFALSAQELGAGEILLNAVDRDGTMEGMDLKLIRDVAPQLSIPLIAIGGVGSLAHLRAAKDAGASAIAAGAFFVFQGPHRAILISFPRYEQLTEVLA
jgi:cyclase